MLFSKLYMLMSLLLQLMDNQACQHMQAHIKKDILTQKQKKEKKKNLHS